MACICLYQVCSISTNTCRYMPNTCQYMPILNTNGGKTRRVLISNQYSRVLCRKISCWRCSSLWFSLYFRRRKLTHQIGWQYIWISVLHSVSYWKTVLHSQPALLFQVVFRLGKLMRNCQVCCFIANYINFRIHLRQTLVKSKAKLSQNSSMLTAKPTGSIGVTRESDLLSQNAGIC